MFKLTERIIHGDYTIEHVYEGNMLEEVIDLKNAVNPTVLRANEPSDSELEKLKKAFSEHIQNGGAMQ